MLAASVSACQASKPISLPQLANSVVKVIASTPKHRLSFGSGVVTASNQVATNCHVTRAANNIMVEKNSVRYAVYAQSIDAERDICLLHLKHLRLPSVTLADVASATSGDNVVAFGYPNAIGISLRRGKILKLHPYLDSYIIETDIGIKDGASGGGLFNEQGQLVGLTTFYRRDLGGRYYVIPANWLTRVSNLEPQPIAAFAGSAFWQKPGGMHLE